VGLPPVTCCCGRGPQKPADAEEEAEEEADEDGDGYGSNLYAYLGRAGSPYP